MSVERYLSSVPDLALTYNPSLFVHEGESLLKDWFTCDGEGPHTLNDVVNHIYAARDLPLTGQRPVAARYRRSAKKGKLGKTFEELLPNIVKQVLAHP